MSEMRILAVSFLCGCTCSVVGAGDDARDGVADDAFVERSLAVSFFCGFTCSGVGPGDDARDGVADEVFVERSLAISFFGFAGSDAGAGDDARDGVGDEVRRPRSLMVSLTGFTGSGGGMVMLVCCESTPLDSSDELSVPSGVESESKSGRGERRFRARRCWSSSSPSTLGLGRFLEKVSGTRLTLGGPV
jgi:hypothetical protein